MFTVFAMSAGDMPAVMRASAAVSALPSWATLPMYMSNSRCRSGKVGNPSRTSMSKRPGRRIASSMLSSWLVAATTTTLSSASKPSISTSTRLMMRFNSDSAPPPSPLRVRLPMPSTSSMNSTHGALWRASLNSSLTLLTPAP